jgi:N-acetylglucosaminyldiphosphoundecaprenol N-acetyl-beta-D-mannosaminyltransferase
MGKRMNPFDLRVIKVGNRPLANVDLWIHYLRGDINLVGPRALSVNEASRLPRQDCDRFSVAPGMISPFQIKRKSCTDYAGERNVAAEFANNATPLRRLQILVTCFCQWFCRAGNKRLSVPESVSLFGVILKNVSMQEALNSIMAHIKSGVASTKTAHVSFVNADCVNKYVADAEYQRVLQRCEHVFADGVGVRLAARWHRAQLKSNVNGTDLFPLLCRRLASDKKRVFLYGGHHSVVKMVARNLTREFPGISVAGYQDGYSQQDDPEFVCDQINQSQADIVFVALGAPLQEKWIDENQHRLKASLAMGVGGLFDFYSGQVSRAPEWVRELSLEWVWRLMVQPKDKAKRYLIGNPLFLMRVFRSNRTRTELNGVLEVC